MIRKRNQIPVLVIALVLFFSCNDDQEPEHSFQKITLSYFEQFEQDTRSLIMSLETTEEFSCSNFTIQADINRSDDQIDITTNNIELPNVCINNLGPATRIFNLGDAATIPSDFTIWINNNKHDFSLNVSDEMLTVKKGAVFNENLEFQKDSIHRIPDNVVWGYIVNNQDTRFDNMDQLISFFKNNDIDPLILDNGDYYHFTVESENLYIESGENREEGFSLYHEGSIDKIVELFNQFLAEEETGDWNIRIFSTNGERYLM